MIKKKRRSRKTSSWHSLNHRRDANGPEETRVAFEGGLCLAVCYYELPIIMMMMMIEGKTRNHLICTTLHEQSVKFRPKTLIDVAGKCNFAQKFKFPKLCTYDRQVPVLFNAQEPQDGWADLFRTGYREVPRAATDSATILQINGSVQMYFGMLMRYLIAKMLDLRVGRVTIN